MKSSSQAINIQKFLNAFHTFRYGTVRYGTVRYGTVRYGTLEVENGLNSFSDKGRFLKRSQNISLSATSIPQ